MTLVVDRWKKMWLKVTTFPLDVGDCSLTTTLPRCVRCSGKMELGDAQAASLKKPRDGAYDDTSASRQQLKKVQDKESDREV